MIFGYRMYKKTLNNYFYLLLLYGSLEIGGCYHVTLTSNGPIVKGADIVFVAELYDGEDIPSGSFTYTWNDNAFPQHTRKFTGEHMDTWVVSYDKNTYAPGPYEVQVVVCKYIMGLYCYNVGSNRLFFDITELLNGNLELVQRNKTRPNLFVSNKDQVTHEIVLKKSDAQEIQKAPTVLTFWFVDCTYYGFSKNFSFNFTYPVPDKQHTIEALVVADFTPLPPPPTTTTTTSTTTTPKPTNTSTTVPPNIKSTTVPPKLSQISRKTITSIHPLRLANETTTGDIIVKNVVKRDTISNSLNSTKNNTTKIRMIVNGTLVPYNDRDGHFPFVCGGSKIAMDPNKTYGYFRKTIKVREPVESVNITGNNWLQHGDILSLNVKCKGSKTISYCVNYIKGEYNVTGNETCNDREQIDSCSFTIQRYFIESTKHTVLIILENDINKVVTPVTVTVYKVQKQAQLSVIVVPVVSSFVAVVLIVFGVAYYLQNRSRFIVEVADFNFGKQYSDMEYKTFRERLTESITTAFTRAPSPTNSETPVWPPGRKYGSMT